jgi:phage gp36-like protein
MAYATIADVMLRYKPIRTLIGSEDLQVASSEVSSIFINDAESVVDAIIGRQYVVPLNPVPAYITQVTADIAIFNMLVEHLPQKPDFFQPRYDRAMNMLLSISSGYMIINSATVVSSGDSEAYSTTQNYHSVFSPVLPMEEQTVDKDRVDADQVLRVGDVGYVGED